MRCFSSIFRFEAKGKELIKTVIETKYGKIIGLDYKDFSLYKGIPYAKPPIGEMRFRPPVAPDAWEEI